MNEITIYDRMENPMQAVSEMGKAFAASGMFGCTNDAQGHVLALACMAERKNPLELSRVYHIINGRLSMRADAMLAEFMKLGGKVTWKKFDGKAATAAFSFDGNEVEISYTEADAKTAGLLPAKPNSGWAKDPAAMLRARLISRAIRMLAPQVCSGYYTPEEVIDFEPVKQTVSVIPEPTPVERQALPDVIIHYREKVTAWLREHGHLPENQELEQLGEPLYSRMCQDPDKLLEKAGVA